MRISLTDRPIDWPIIAVRSVLAVTAFIVLVVIKLITSLSWPVYLLIVGALAAAALIACGLYIKRKGRPNVSKTTLGGAEQSKEPTPEHVPVNSATGSVAQVHELRRPHVDPEPTVGIPVRRRGFQESGPRCIFTRNDEENEPLETIIFERHWKMAVIEAVPPVTIFIALAIAIAMYGDELGFATWQQALVILACIGLMHYSIRRAIFSYRHRLIKIFENQLIVEVPRSIFYWFLGNPLALDIDDTTMVSLEKATPLEMLFFKRVQTVTLDTAAAKDTQAHYLKHVVDAKLVKDAVFRRKQELRFRPL